MDIIAGLLWKWTNLSHAEMQRQRVAKTVLKEDESEDALAVQACCKGADLSVMHYLFKDKETNETDRNS